MFKATSLKSCHEGSPFKKATSYITASWVREEPADDEGGTISKSPQIIEVKLHFAAGSDVSN